MSINTVNQLKTLKTSTKTLVEAELSYHEEMANFLMSLARLEELTGMELVAGGSK